MRRLLHLRTRFLAGLVLVLLGAGCLGSSTTIEIKEEAAPATVKSGARSWPMFGGTLHRNLAAAEETGLPDNWSIQEGKTKNIKWSVKLGDKALGGPIVAGGRIFVGTNRAYASDKEEFKGVLMCFRESDGKFLWQAVHDLLKDGTGAQVYGIVSSPCVEGERVYYVNNRWEVVCADAAGNGGGKAKILWTLDMVKELKVFPGGLQGSLSICSPLVVEDRVFVITANGVEGKGQVPAPDAPSFIAVDKNTGKVVWQDHSPGKNIMDGQWASPAAAKVNGQWHVYFPGGDGWLYAFEAKSGKLVWKFDCNPKKSEFRPGRGNRNYIVATPVIWENKLYLATGRQPDEGNGEGHLWCIDITKTPKNADKDLSPVGDNFDPKAEVNKDSGLVWHFGGPVVPKPEGAGREYVFGRSVSSVAVHDGLLYAAELAGYLNCLDARTGKKHWEFDMKSNTWSSPLYADGKVFIGSEDSNMFVFAHGQELKKPTKIDMSEQLLSPPTAVNGVLYVSNGSNLYAIAAK